jgi:hypothetical protein
MKKPLAIKFLVNEDSLRPLTQKLANLTGCIIPEDKLEMVFCDRQDLVIDTTETDMFDVIVEAMVGMLGGYYEKDMELHGAIPLKEASPLEELTNMQRSVGYQEGEINIIALLGLIGEAGEVLEEWLHQYHTADFKEYPILIMLEKAVQLAKSIDGVKKVYGIQMFKLGYPSLTGH